MNTHEYEDMYSNDTSVLSIFVRFGNNYNIYERNVYSIVDLLGDFGGL